VILSGKLCTVSFSPEEEMSILIQNVDTSLTDNSHNICLVCPQNLKSRTSGKQMKLRVFNIFFSFPKMRILYVVL